MKDLPKVVSIIGMGVICIVSMCSHPVMGLWAIPAYDIFAGIICRR